MRSSNPIERCFELAAERCEDLTPLVASHDAYRTPRRLFAAFFDIVADTLRDILGADWSAEIENSWQKLLQEIEGIVAASET